MKLIVFVVIFACHSAVNASDEEIQACRELALDITDESEITAGVCTIINYYIYAF